MPRSSSVIAPPPVCKGASGDARKDELGEKSVRPRNGIGDAPEMHETLELGGELPEVGVMPMPPLEATEVSSEVVPESMPVCACACCIASEGEP